jgi:DNA ligase (NAD+)
MSTPSKKKLESSSNNKGVAKNQKIQSEMKGLEEEIRSHQYFYYLENNPKITDKDFDLLFQKLKKLEEKYPDLTNPNSPTKLVGSDLSSSTEFEKVKHKIPVLSLENTYNTEELLDWVLKTGEDQVYSVEWKIDGASIVLYYEKGILKKAVTRGTGGVGDDITDNIKTVQNLPHKLQDPLNLYIRGEVFMTFEDFEQFNEDFGGKYANPRNLTSGSIKHKYASEVAKRPINLYAYDAYFPDGRKEIQTQKQALDLIQNQGLAIPPNISFVSANEIKKLVEKLKKKKDSMPFPIDGLVIKLNDLSLRDSLGETSHSPRWARAYKFSAMVQESIIEDIIPQVGRTGKITPRARIKPVHLAGTTVTFATLHNQDYINELGVGLGARVKISKRGEIIPAVEEVVEPGLKGVYRLPNKCPSCGSSLQKVDDSVDIFCINKQCPDRMKRSIEFYCQKKQMDIDGLGEKQIEIFFDKKWIQKISDLYELKNFKDKMESLEGFGSKSVAIILEGIEKSKSKSLRTVLPSLGLNEIGHKVTEILIESGYDSIDAILSLAKDPDASEKLKSMHGIGPRTIVAFLEQFKDPLILEQIAKLKKLGLNFQAEQIEKSDNLVFNGQSWCVTGSFENFQPRDRAMDIIVKHGGRKVSSISSKTTHLLYGEGAGSKLSKAEELGILLISEKDFIHQLEKEKISYRLDEE